MTTVFRSVTVTRSYEQVVQQIQEGIRCGSLKPGQKLPTERELGESFGVSRGVVREAIKMLDAMGLVESRQGSGIYVRSDPRPSVSRAFTLSVSPEEKSLARLFEFRQSLESVAARYAAERRTDAEAEEIIEAAIASASAADAGDKTKFGLADNRFHAAIHAATDNPYLSVALGAIREMQGDVVRLFSELTGSMTVASEHHLRVADAIKRQDTDTAAVAMDEHIAYTSETVGTVLRETTGEG